MASFELLPGINDLSITGAAKLILIFVAPEPLAFGITVTYSLNL
jgi:hypothetical protein